MLTAYATLTPTVSHAIVSPSKQMVFMLRLSDEGECDEGFFFRPFDRGRV